MCKQIVGFVTIAQKKCGKSLSENRVYFYFYQHLRTQKKPSNETNEFIVVR